MKVVLDTNVLLAALISPHAPPDRIYRAWRARHFELITSEAQRAELRRASRYPKLKAILPAHRAGALLNHLQGATVLGEGLATQAIPEALGLADPADEFLLVMCLASGADYLVTGDRRSGLLQRAHVGRTRIVTAAVFCETVLHA
jgi:putative PIN family toxin of toxin-antitoxin system